jgi:hypothetical protein
MDRPTAAKQLTFSFGVNHETERLDVVIGGTNDAEAKGSLTVDQIDDLMASLSQFQYALFLSKASGEQLTSTFYPQHPFKARGGYILAKRDAISGHKVGVDDTEGSVGLLVLGLSGRLTGYRMSREKARQLARDLLTAADQIRAQPKRSFDA